MPSPHDPAVRRLAAAVLMPGFTGSRERVLPDWLARETEAGLGGVCLFAPNVGSDVADLTGALHGIRPDVVIASDEEGGEVTRLEAADGSSWPTHAALGRAGDTGATTAVAEGIGRLCRAAGIDLALAPDADVTSDPDNPVIGLRSFGSDPRQVGRHAAAFVSGLQGVGVAACVKHFPGHGDTHTDSHLGLPVIDVDLETLRARDLPPFEAAVLAGVRAVMTAHVVFPALDQQPATLSSAVLELLRGELGFSGVIVSDAVDMQAISAGIGRGPGAAMALAAGVDLVCIGNPSHPVRYDDEAAYHEVHASVVDAVVAGRLPLDRLEEAVRRIAELAWWVGENRAAGLAADAEVGRSGGDVGAAAREAAARVARAALEVHDVALAPGPAHVLDLRGAPGVAAGPRPSGVIASLRERRPDLVVHELSTSPEPVHALSAALTGAQDQGLVVVTSGPRRSPTVERHLASVLAARPDAVVVATGLLPEHVGRAGRDDHVGAHWIRTFGDTRNAGAAVADVLWP